MQRLPQRILGLVIAAYFASDYFFPGWGGPWKVVPLMVLGVVSAIQLIVNRRKANADVTLNIPR